VDLTRDSALTGVTLLGTNSPAARSLYSAHSRQSSWDDEEDEKKKKKRSWSIKARLSARREVKEMI
jgi:hypothetical protein